MPKSNSGSVFLRYDIASLGLRGLTHSEGIAYHLTEEGELHHRARRNCGREQVCLPLRE